MSRTPLRKTRNSTKQRRRARFVEKLESRDLLAADAFAAPDGGWAYRFEGDGAADGGADATSLDGTWSHDNGSDAWDGSAIGEGNPGGVSALVDGDTNFIRVQDTGDPRGILGIEDPSNRKEYFTHVLDADFTDDTRPDNLDSIIDDGVTLYFRIRVATAATGPVDDLYADGATEAEPWPEDGLGYYQHNGGKSVIAIKQQGGTMANVALGLARGANVNEELFVDEDGNSLDGLILPHLLQDVATSDESDPGSMPALISEANSERGNVVTVDEITEWQEFWVTIEAGSTTVDDFEDGTHIVNVYYAGSADPLAANTFGITAATGNDGTSSYIAIGAGGTPRSGAIDVDFFAWAPGVNVPTLGDGGGSTISDLTDVTAPGDELVRVDGEDDGDGSDGPPPGGEMVEHVIDDVTQKHLNFLDLGSGFIVTPSAGESIITGLRLYTANDAIERDPASYILEGGLADGSFTLISEGDLALPDARNAGGDIPIDVSLALQEISFENTTAYVSYRLTFPTLKDAAAANSMQIAEVEFLGDIVGPAIDVSAGTAAQSSQLGDFVAANALDDVVNFTHTMAGDENPTWQVLLPDTYAFDTVTVFNRGASEGTLSCCPSRLRDITVQIVQFDGDVTTDFTGGVVTSSSDLLNPENVLGGGTNTSGPISLTDKPGGAIGNLIRVIRTPDDDLSGTGGEGNDDEGSVLSLDLVVARGRSVGGSSLAADVDGNGEVGFSDFLILAENFGKEVAPNTLGDIDGNGKVEFSDFLILAEDFGKTAAAAAVDAALADDGLLLG